MRTPAACVNASLIASAITFTQALPWSWHVNPNAAPKSRNMCDVISQEALTDTTW